jgi:tetratricopeptide (TPR) repeat protein
MSTITQTGATIGTPSYMSPEQVMGKKVDNRSDIFSLGAILYELLAGERPFVGESITTVIYKIVNEEATPLTHVNQKLPLEFEPILAKALAKDPDCRYASCSELAADLRRIAHFSDETVAMTDIQDSKRNIEVRGRKKNRLPLSIALIGAVIAAGVGGFFLYQKFVGKPSSSRIEQPILVESEMPDPRPTLSVLEGMESESDKLVKSYERGDYSESIRIAQSILSIDKQNKQAIDYLARARNKISEDQIIRYISAGKKHYESGDYDQCLISMDQALQIDGKNSEARRYYDLADQAISEETIRQIVERQRKAEEQKDLLAFINDIGPETLSAKKRTDAMQLFNNFDDINSRIGDIEINFIDRDHADVSFSHLLVAVDKKTRNNKVIFEGKKTLTFERLENTWKILVYR